MMMKKTVKNLRAALYSHRGFTLIEILVTLALTGIIMSAVYAIYIANLRALGADESRLEIQQGQRFSLDFMARELRHAGYDLAESGAPTIVRAGADYIYFTADLNNDGVLDDAGEHIVFCRFNNVLGYFTAANGNIGNIDADNDGLADAGHVHVAAVDVNGNGIPDEHDITAQNSGVMSVIENLEFYYTLSDGTQTTTPTLAGVDLSSIREIDISLLSRAERDDAYYFSGGEAYTTASGTVWNGFNDNIRRMLLSMNVRLRNMGL